MSVVHDTLAFGLEQREECAVPNQPIPKSAAIKRSDHTLYLACMLSTLRKINEAESTSMNTYYIPGFEVPMDYPNAMKILYQLVYLHSEASHV